MDTPGDGADRAEVESHLQIVAIFIDEIEAVVIGDGQVVHPLGDTDENRFGR